MGERLSGKGALEQLKMETGLPLYELEPALLLIIALLATWAAVGSVGGGDLTKAPGLSSLGIAYTSDRQRLVGRLSMAAFASALIAEALTGSGPLALLELDTGVPVDEIEAGMVFLLLLLGTGDTGGTTPRASLAGALSDGGDGGSDWETDSDMDETDWHADDGEADDD
jgi:hypothetical protein